MRDRERERERERESGVRYARKIHILAVLFCWFEWRAAVPSLRARDCTAAEKEALNLAFVGIP